MKLSYLFRGLPGHPIHPPLTDATIGTYTFATAAAILSKLYLAEHAFATAWWLAVVVGLIAGALTALTGLFDWITITRGTPLFRTATSHMLAMVTATVLFLLAAIVGHKGYVEREVNTSGLIFTILGFLALTIGGWLGGAVTYVHGMRVLNLVEEPASRAAAPVPHEEKKRAES